MEDNNEQIKKKKLSSSAKQNIVAALVVVLIFIYVIAECASVLNVKLKTQTALTSTVYDTLDVQALVVRDEDVIPNGDGSVTVASLADGEKIQTGGEIAMQFANRESAVKYSKYLELQSELEYYTDLESQSVGLATDVETLDKDILTDVNDYIRSISAEDGTSINTYEKSLNDKFTRRQMLIGQDVNFTSAIEAINDEIGVLNIAGAEPTGYIKADKSGVFSGYTDGFEKSFDYSKIEELDTDTLKSYISAVNDGGDNQSQAQNNLGKIINSFDWYFCAVVNSKSIAGIKEGKSIDVTLKDSNEVLKCKVVKGADDSVGGGETVLVLKCNEINGEITSLRLEDIQIRVHEYTGIKVPVDAVHVVNGEKGVYALVSSVVEWRKADVLYTGDNYVVLSYDKDSENGIKLYDQIIVQGKDLHDGKVYT